MYEILRLLPRESAVLDLGCASGSFPAQATAAVVVRLDIHTGHARPEELNGGREARVTADAALLPFRNGAFHAVISNHSLEHFENLDAVLSELARVIRPDSALYAAVPDATTFTDRLHRWLARGGGHVNAFRHEAEVVRLIERATGLRHVAAKPLCSSSSFLNRRHRKGRTPLRLALMGGGADWTLWLYVLLSRAFDRWFGTRLSIYEWALYFGACPRPVDTAMWCNVCVRCGSGSPATGLVADRAVRRVFRLPVFRCPHCGATTPFFADSEPAATAQPGADGASDRVAAKGAGVPD